MDTVPLVHLNLSHNLIQEADGLEQQRMKTLRNLDLSNNQIQQLRGLVTLENLRILSLANNQIRKVGELRHLEELLFVCEVDFSNNPVQTAKFYQ